MDAGGQGAPVKFQHRLRSPISQAGHNGLMPRGAHESQGLSTTRSPTARPVAYRAQLHHVGHHLVAEHLRERREVDHRVMGIDESPMVLPQSMNTCLASEPQMPVRRGLISTQSGRGSLGLGHPLERHRRVGQAVEQRVAGGRGIGGSGATP